MARPQRGRGPHVERVTPREREVLRALGLGLTNAGIAELLHISTRTVESHVASLMRKYEVHARALLASPMPVPSAGGRPADPGRPTPVNTAELDRDGVIVRVNASWERFCADNDGDLARCGAGVSYLQVCRDADDRDSRTVAAYIRLATRGGVFVPLPLRLDCSGPDRPMTCDLIVSSRVDDDGYCLGATVSVAEATLVPRAVGMPPRKAVNRSRDAQVSRYRMR